jgi:outer membrane receptor protein involved in Fe transport
MKQILLFAICITVQLQLLSQDNEDIQIHGTIVGMIANDPISATVKIKNEAVGVLADTRGTFTITISQLPATLVISAVGYESQELTVITRENVIARLTPYIHEIDGVMITGVSKSKMRQMLTAVSNEWLGRNDLINTPTESYWSAMSKKTGLDFTTSSLTYKTYSTRGFNGSGSSRVNQYMDGMDNQAPGLNFSVGNFIGLTELDVESIEILPGASSALYGSGGVNGTILVNSKNPFLSPGFSFVFKQGVTGIDKDQRGKAGVYNDFAFRWAQKISDRFAFKLAMEYLRANDWLANDSSNYLRMGSSGKTVSGNRQSDPDYDGVNVYGDETHVDLRGFMNSSPTFQAMFANYLSNPQFVSRTGYSESATIDPKTWNLKLSGALHYKITKNIEAQLMGYWGTGNTVYTGNNRYVFKGIKMGQYKFELKNDSWFFRTYTTQENAGEAYSATVTSQYFNEAWKTSYDPANAGASWYTQYFTAFATRAGQIFQSVLTSGGTMSQAQAAVYAAAPELHSLGRELADQGRPQPGSDDFKKIFEKVRMIPIPRGGMFLDKSQLWMTEGQYNFSDNIKFAEVIVGGNFKKYILNSNGTIFIDTTGALRISEAGAYAQVSKKIFRDRLALSASGRFDKNQHFKGKITPRFTALYTFAKDHHFRMSYQTAYRFPTTQQQWIKLDVGSAFLLGGLPWIQDYLQLKSMSTFVVDPAYGGMTPYTYKELRPESLRSFEFGYKSLIKKKLLLDAYTYFGRYSDFLGRIILVQPGGNKPFSIVTNNPSKVRTTGYGFSMDYKLPKNYNVFINFYSDKLSNVPENFEVSFNTPKYRVNAGVVNSGLGKQKRFGFAANIRWQDTFYWEGGGFANGMVDAYTTIDAQVNYKIPRFKSIIKLGGTNITNKYYQTAFGNPSIGGLYYLSYAFNIQ